MLKFKNLNFTFFGNSFVSVYLSPYKLILKIENKLDIYRFPSVKARLYLSPSITAACSLTASCSWKFLQDI